MSLFDSVRRSLFEDEERKEEKPAEEPQGPRPVISISVEASSENSEEMYQRVLSSTRFENTDVGKTIHKYVQAMEGANLGEAVTLKTAITQAKRLDGITDEDVFKCFTDMRNALEGERAGFEKIIEDTKKDEITSREETLKKINEEYNETQQKLTQLQAEASKLTAQLAEWQGKLARGQSQFAAAVQRRAAEIGAENSKMSTLLGVPYHV